MDGLEIKVDVQKLFIIRKQTSLNYLCVKSRDLNISIYQ